MTRVTMRSPQWLRSRVGTRPGLASEEGAVSRPLTQKFGISSLAVGQPRAPWAPWAPVTMFSSV